jgi:surfeit locus 1 family protein
VASRWLASRRFAPRLVPTLLALVAVACLTGLGTWQLGRAAEKRALLASFAAGEAPAVPLPAANRAHARYLRVLARGSYLDDRQFLLDNMTHAGQAGYRVLTPLLTDDGALLLVDRGWIPPGTDRARLPSVGVSAQARAISGRLDALPRAGLHLEAPAEAGWPRRISYPTQRELEAALGRRVYPEVLLLDAAATDGYLREWQPPGLTPDRHLGYALQWYALALTLAVLYVVLHLQPRENA